MGCHLNSIAVPQKILNTELPYDIAILPPGTHSKELKAGFQRYLYTHVHSRIIHNNQSLRATQVPIDQEIVKPIWYV